MSESLTPVQQQVIALLADGSSVKAAADALNIHRTTIHHWKRTNPDFANALADAKEDAADHFQSQCRQHGATVIAALLALLEDGKASASVRFKAALLLMNGAQGVAPKPARVSSPFITSAAVPAPMKNAVSSPFITSEKVQTYVRPAPKVGRNEPCPCASGRKYKQCCLNAAHQAA